MAEWTDDVLVELACVVVLGAADEALGSVLLS